MTISQARNYEFHCVKLEISLAIFRTFIRWAEGHTTKHRHLMRQILSKCSRHFMTPQSSSRAVFFSEPFKLSKLKLRSTELYLPRMSLGKAYICKKFANFDGLLCCFEIFLKRIFFCLLIFLCSCKVIKNWIVFQTRLYNNTVLRFLPIICTLYVSMYLFRAFNVLLWDANCLVIKIWQYFPTLWVWVTTGTKSWELRWGEEEKAASIEQDCLSLLISLVNVQGPRQSKGIPQWSQRCSIICGMKKNMSLSILKAITLPFSINFFIFFVEYWF